MALYAVSYDLPNDKRRTRLFKTLSNFGERVQYSVFECYLDDRQLARLKAKLAEILEEEEDRVRLYRICEACRKRVEVIGLGEPLPWGEAGGEALIL